MRDLLVTEVDIKDTIGQGRTHCHRVAAKCLTHKIEPIAVGDAPILLNFPDLIYGPVLDRWQLRRICPRAYLVPAGRSSHIKNFMRPIMVILISPSAKMRMAVLDIRKALIANQLCLKGAVESLLLPLRLRMVRTRVPDIYTKPNQPHHKWAVLRAMPAGPRSTVVSKDSPRQPISLKGRDKTPLHCIAPPLPDLLQAELGSSGFRGLLPAHPPRVG